MNRKIELLVVEDNPADVSLIREALRALAAPVRLSTVADGEQALSYLRREGHHEGAVRPDLILLDLNLPRLDGHDVLRAVKGDPVLRRIPVIVLTTSQAGADVDAAYAQHANCYLVKPQTWEQFLGLMAHVHAFWLTVAALPHAGELRALAANGG